MTNKLSLIILVTAAFFMTADSYGQESRLVKVPKQYSFETGYRNLFLVKNLDTDVKHGYGFLFDYAWQLSGLDGSKAASYITVPLGYTTMISASDTSGGLSMLCYGWTVRHHLAKSKKWTPYLGYGLLLNRIRESDREGSVMGHQTQFEFGYNLKTARRLQYVFKVQYSYSSYPRFDEKEKIKAHFFDIRAGIRF